MEVDDLSLTEILNPNSSKNVYLTTKKDSEVKYATKVVDKTKYKDPLFEKYLKSEMTVLSNISHPNLIKLIEIKESPEFCFIVTEYCNGGNLSTYFDNYKKENNNQPFTEEIVQYIMKQIIQGIKYLHENNIIHRKINMDNILINYENEEDLKINNIMKSTIKIIDFSYSRFLEKNELAYTTIGIPLNMSPILLDKLINKSEKGYDEKEDIWELGTICYEMLVGNNPFNSDDVEDLFNKINIGDYSVPNCLSKEAVAFLHLMIRYYPEDRSTEDELLESKFIKNNVSEFSKINLEEINIKEQDANIQINTRVNYSLWKILGI